MSRLSEQSLDARRLLVRIFLAFALMGGLLLEAAPRAFADVETANDYQASEQAEETVPVEPSAPDEAALPEASGGVGASSGGAEVSGASGGGESLGSTGSLGSSGSSNAAAQNATAVGLEVALSEPVASNADGLTSYTSTLTVAGIDALFGYQLRVAAPAGASVTIRNLVGGSATEPTYKEGSVYQAVLLGGEGMNVGVEGSAERDEGVVLCEVTVSYAADSAKAERVLTVEQVQIVTDLRAETMLTLGPTPPAATMALASVEVPLAVPASWLPVAGLAVLALVVFAVLLVRKRNRRPRHYARARRQPPVPAAPTPTEHTPAHTAPSH